MSVRRKIWSLPVIACLLFALGIAAVVVSSSRTVKAIADLGQWRYPALDHASRAVSLQGSFSATLQSAVAEGEPKRLDDARERAQELGKVLVAQADLLRRQGQRAELPALFERYRTAALQAAGLMLGQQQGDTVKAVAAMQSSQKSFEEALVRERERAQRAFDSGLVEADHGVRASLLVTVVSGLLVVVVLVLASWRVIRAVWRELGGEPEYVRHALQRMASGDLGSPLQVQGGDRTSLLAALAEMQRGLRQLVGRVRESTHEISTASSGIARGNEDLSARTVSQAGSLQQTAGAMEQLTATLQRNADHAHQSSGIAEAASKEAEQASAAMGEVVRSMEFISTRSAQIESIVALVRSIAFQTNVLALNAAVEAARAGEQGRGFAVVASEVRTLAQRSEKAANEISALISGSVGEIQRGAELVGRAGASMDRLTHSVQRVHAFASGIAQASAAQAGDIAATHAALSSMDDLTRRNAQMVRHAASAAASLEEQVARLAQAVDSFRLETPAHVAG